MSRPTVLAPPELTGRLATEGLQCIFAYPVPPRPELGGHCPTEVQAYAKPGYPIVAGIWLAPMPHLTFLVAYPPGGISLDNITMPYALAANYCPGNDYTILGLEWLPGFAATAAALADTVLAMHRLLMLKPILPLFPELDLGSLFPAWVNPEDVHCEDLDICPLEPVVKGDIWFRKCRKGGFLLLER